MAFELKDGEGTLWKNDKKEGDDRDYNGSIKITKPGEYWVSGYVNTSKSGKRYLKLTTKELSFWSMSRLRKWRMVRTLLRLGSNSNITACASRTAASTTSKSSIRTGMCSAVSAVD